jgi:hypothetical protein
MPGVIGTLAPQAPLRTLALQELEPLDYAGQLDEATDRIVNGASLADVCDEVAGSITSAEVSAREREIDWLIAQLELRFEPGEDGLGRLWEAAAARLRYTPPVGTLLSGGATARAVIGLAAARDDYEIAAALANAIGAVSGSSG